MSLVFMRLQPSGKAPHFVGQHQGLDKFKTYIQPHNAGIESSNLSRRTNSRNAYFVMTSIVDAYSNFNCTYLLNKNTQKASSPFLKIKWVSSESANTGVCKTLS